MKRLLLYVFILVSLVSFISISFANLDLISPAKSLDALLTAIKQSSRLCDSDVAIRMSKVAWEMAKDKSTRNALLKMTTFMTTEIDLMPRLLKNADDMTKFAEFFTKYGDEAGGLLKNISNKYGDDIAAGIWHNKTYTQDILRNIFKDLETISEVKGADKLAREISRCNNLGRAFEAEVAAKNVSKVEEVSKNIPGTEYEIDVFLKNNTIIEAKASLWFATGNPSGNSAQDLKKQIDIFKQYYPNSKIEVYFKHGVSAEIKNWLEGMGVIVK